MPRVALLVTGAREFVLADGSTRPTGLWAEQALTSYERLMAAGADVVVMTPDGRSPVVDPYSLEPFFHHPVEDRGYFASVHRTFHPDPDDVRITLHHATDLELVAARRIARRLELADHSREEAHRLIGRAALIAWRQDRRLVDVMIADGLDGGLGEASLRAAVDELAVVSEAVAEDRRAYLAEIDGFTSPVAPADQTDTQLDTYDALLAPGGYGAMVDLPADAGVARLVSALHGRGAPIATQGHGAAALLAAPDRLDGQWLFEGFRVTCSTDEEELQTEYGRRGMPWYLASALQNAGAILDDAAYPWASHVVVDRNLITGQNLYSTEATVGALLRALDLHWDPPRH